MQGYLLSTKYRVGVSVGGINCHFGPSLMCCLIYLKKNKKKKQANEVAEVGTFMELVLKMCTKKCKCVVG